MNVLLLLCSVLCMAGSPEKKGTPKQLNENIIFVAQQVQRMVDTIDAKGKVLVPRTTVGGKLAYTSTQDWISGFFSGTLWYLYALTGEQSWREQAEKHTCNLEQVQYLKWHHDIGFMIGDSYGNAYRLGQDTASKKVVVQAARSLSTRFRPGAGVIQSWDADRGWQGKKGWKCPVIIDNMMNLELLFEATKFSGDSSFYKMAVSHADQTLRHHYRADNSCYHVVDYDPATGEVRKRNTGQGYADESSWARGQAWGLYGFTLCYRYTRNEAYLKQAAKIAAYLSAHPRMPEDLVPYWDLDAPNIPDEPRDASAAAVIASALYELDLYTGKNYRRTADRIMKSLSSPAYRAKAGENGNFILMHSVGSIPHNAEIDVPLVYADYYYVEALYRQQLRMNRQKRIY